MNLVVLVRLFVRMFDHPVANGLIGHLMLFSWSHI